ncbi:gastrula zinc finger protein XlCGF49.1-like [Carassius gibelio]|uniref:gastrula zinc finger protein XlCGF49.1-like n=1 Tax=Carassius gibelio TaxID=101364 RepID=UPI00227941C7|nr:gastrula zinc finger protein XlCGF49.1-like [Carassius gibelio]
MCSHAPNGARDECSAESFTCSSCKCLLIIPEDALMKLQMIADGCLMQTHVEDAASLPAFHPEEESEDMNYQNPCSEMHEVPEEQTDEMEGEERPYLCPMCGKSFSRLANCKKHQKIHSSVKKHACVECGKTFITPEYLRKHQKTHSTERPFTCSQCGLSFKVKGHLVTHERIHTGKKPHTCHQCGKSFIQSSGLTYHLLHHSGEKAFKCDQCGKDFTSSANLKKTPHTSYE